MTTFLAGLLFAVCFAVLLNTRRVLSVRHKRKLAEARLELTTVVTEMQEPMATGLLAHGEKCHDVLYGMMFWSQSLDRYCSLKAFFRPDRHEVQKTAGTIFEELSTKSEEVQVLVCRFMNAYLKALRYRQPCLYYTMFGIIIIRCLSKSLQLNWNVVQRKLASWAIATEKAEASDIGSAQDPILA
jgi:hypothetical protein